MERRTSLATLGVHDVHRVLAYYCATQMTRSAQEMFWGGYSEYFSDPGQ